MRNIFDQVFSDLFGKDVRSTPTYSYTWMADQLGHIALGWITVYGVYMAQALVWDTELYLETMTLGDRATVGPSRQFLLLYVVLPFAVWAGKELLDYRAAVREAQGFFPFDHADLQSNVRIALLYFTIGILIGAAALLGPGWTAAILPALALVGVTAAVPWVTQKMTLQQMAVPYLLRLADFPGRTLVVAGEKSVAHKIGMAAAPATTPTADQLRAYINDFIHLKMGKRRHMVITAEGGRGNSQLAVALATELGYNGHVVRYMSFSQFLDLTVLDTPDFQPIGLEYWDWRRAQVIVVDEIDVVFRPWLAEDPRTALAALRRKIPAAVRERIKIGMWGTVWALTLPPDRDDSRERRFLDALVAAFDVTADELFEVRIRTDA